MTNHRLASAVVGILAIAGSARADIGIFQGNIDLGEAGNPALVGSSSFDGTKYTVTGSGTDWWEWDGERAQFLYKQITGDFRLEASVNVLGDPANDWAKFGVAFRNTINTGPANTKDVNAFVAVTDPFRGTPLGAFQGRYLAGQPPMFNYQKEGTQPSKVALQRKNVGGDWFLVEGFLDVGSGWEKVAQKYMSMAATGYAGLAVTSHDNSRTESAEFSNVALTAPIATPPAAQAPASIVNTGGQGGMGYFDVTEVVNNGGLGNNTIATAVGSLNNGTGDRYSYQTAVLNIQDSGGGGRFGNDGRFGVVNANLFGKTYGNVDDIAMIARGIISIPEAAPYTFVCNSDDGFELSIDGKIVMQADYGKGEGDVLGTVMLSAGEHSLQLIYWEAGGGSSVELYAAKGDWPWFDFWDGNNWVKYANWQLVGDTANGGIALVPEPASLSLLALSGLALLARRRKV